jgi:branched-chain amino acid transport system substrate-binding protein
VSSKPGAGHADNKYTAGAWSPDFPNEANQKFISTFKKKYGYTPSSYAAQSYDAINLLDAGVRAAKGNISDKKALIAAMENANFIYLKS